MTDLSELLRRVERATGPDRELDLALATQLVPDVLVMRQRDDDSGADPYTYWEYTASIDAALALVERCLPLALVKLSQMHDGIVGGHCWLFGPSHEYASDIIEYGRFNSPADDNRLTLPLAILAALLRALSNPPDHST